MTNKKSKDTYTSFDEICNIYEQEIWRFFTKKCAKIRKHKMEWNIMDSKEPTKLRIDHCFEQRKWKILHFLLH